MANETDRAIAVQRIKMQEVMIKRDLWQSCMGCDNYTKENGAPTPFYCTVHHAVPPPNIVVSGCPDYQMDIPF